MNRSLTLAAPPCLAAAAARADRCLIAAIGIMRPSTFAIDQINIKIAAAMTLILIATGETIVVMRGGIDLSVGGMLSLATAICGDARRSRPGRILHVDRLRPGDRGAAIGVAERRADLGDQAAALRRDARDMVDHRRLRADRAAGGKQRRSRELGRLRSIRTRSALGVPLHAARRADAVPGRGSAARATSTRLRAAGSNERSAYLNRVSLLGTNAWAYGLSGFFAAAAGALFRGADRRRIARPSAPNMCCRQSPPW